MEKEQQENTFFYTYSAKQQTEIQAIRQKYLSAASPDEGVERLRKLDRGARLPGVLAAIFLGLFGVLLFAVGLHSVVGASSNGQFVLGVFLGVLCLAYMSGAPLLEKFITKRQRKKLAPEILKLSDELLKCR